MTKPGNSDSPEPTEPPVTDGPSDAAPMPVERKKAEPAEVEPLMTDLEKAPRVSAEEARRAQTKRRFEEPPPRTLRFSFYFFVASGVIWLVNAIQYLVYKQDIIDRQIELNTNQDISPQQITDAITQIIWVMLIAAAAFTIFLSLFGWKATQGTRRARTLVTTFGVILLLFQIVFNSTPIGILSAFLALIALTLLWSKSARAYFPPRERR